MFWHYTKRLAFIVQRFRLAPVRTAISGTLFLIRRKKYFSTFHPLSKERLFCKVILNLERYRFCSVALPFPRTAFAADLLRWADFPQSCDRRPSTFLPYTGIASLFINVLSVKCSQVECPRSAWNYFFFPP